MIGTSLNQYRITAALGAGGMGEVFRARDTRLNRDVAIKVLPKEFAAKADRLRRFEQECRSLAALNYPTILTVHEAGVYEGTPYLVSELLEGKTLREELTGGALTLRKATEYALQLAHGLAGAHSKGVIHRDLKPENIFITKDGRLKILDFGLAKLQENLKSQISDFKAVDGEAPTLADSTQPGMVLGTSAYMSPEQVRGEPTDHRTDIFAFGCVLYEMLVGQRAFRHKSAAETMSAVLKEEPPPLTRTQNPVPAALERLVHRCLEKQPDRRFQTASDLAFALENAETFSSTAVAATRIGYTGSSARWKQVLPWATAALLGLFLVIVFGRTANRSRGTAAVPGSDMPVTKVQLYLPGSGSVMARSTVQVVISPDGKKLTYANDDGLWLYRLDRIAPASRLVSGRDLWTPFWSPSSEEIGYFDEQKLFRTTLDGARPTPICSHLRFRSPHGEGAAWLPGNRIVFATGGGPLLETPASGGGGEASILLPLGPDDKDFEEPCALPDGRGVLFIGWSNHKRCIEVWTPDGRRKELASIRAGFQQPVYSSSGHIIFWRTDQGNEGLWAFPFALDRLERTADPFLVSDVGRVPSASFTGALAFALHQSEFFALRQLIWLDRSGRILGTVGEPIKGLSMPRLSPDARQVVAISREAPRHSRIWLVDAVTGGTLPFLPETAPGRLNTAHWSADGRQIIFMRKGSADDFVIAAKASDGTGEEQVVSKGAAGYVSPSGHYLLMPNRQDSPAAPTDAPVPGYIQLSDPERKLKPFPDTLKEIGPRFCLSSDDRFLAFTLEEGEKSEIFVVDFPSFKNRRLVSRGGGWYPVWKPDSQELFFLGESRRAMMSARLKPGTTEFEPPEKLFDIPALIYSNLAASIYDVAPDGRFLMMKKVEETSTEPGLGKANAQIVLNWFEEFREKNR